MTTEEIVQKPALNQEQQAAHDRAIEYVFNKGENLPKIILITGYAGTGKTFTINRIVDSIKAEENKLMEEKKDVFFPSKAIAASAPTHKAVRVMRKNAELGSSVAYFTIHSLLGLKMEADKKTGKKIFVPSKDPEDGKIQNFDVVIIDEISMLGTDLWEAILEAMEEHSFKLILLGDPAQIPPVNEKDSPALLTPEQYGVETLQLTQSMRQATDNPILAYATAIRENYKSRYVPVDPYVAHDGTHGIIVKPALQVKDVDTLLEDMFCSLEFKQDADHVKVIAWTNKVVDQFNNKIRRMLYAIPDGALGLPMILNGEKLIVDERFVIPGTQGKFLATNEEIEVVDQQVTPKTIQYKIWTPMGYSTKEFKMQIYYTKIRYLLSNGKAEECHIPIVHERSTHGFAAVIKEIVDSALQAPFHTGERSEMWKHKFYIDGLFAKVKYNYAVTAHKSQGSTYQNTFLAEWDIRNNPNQEEKNRILYVGVTRAKKTLYMIQ